MSESLHRGRGKIYKLINVFSMSVLILNMSFLGVFFVAAPMAQAQVYIEPNPALSSSCGIDMVLVIDSSGSINGTELTQMQDAFKDFVNAFLPTTPTMIGVVDFDTSASNLLDPDYFSNDVSTLENAIDDPSSGGGTDWQAALQMAHGIFTDHDPRIDKSNLIIFASDGNPTFPHGYGHITDPEDVSDAIEAANAAKLDGIRIITLGIGDGLDPDNLKAISSDDAYHDTDFGTLADTLADLADELCGGTITVKKLLDGEPAGEGWQFSVVYNGASSTEMTDVNGEVNFEIDIDNGSVEADLTEEVQAGYNLDEAHCWTDYPDNQNEVGDFDGEDTVEGIEVSRNDIITCEFNNVEEPTGMLMICKQEDLNENGELNEGEPVVFGWTFNIVDVGTYTDGEGEDEEDGCVTIELPYGEYNVSEVGQSGWTQTGVSGNGIYNPSDGSVNITIDGPGTFIIYFLNMQEPVCDYDILGYKYNGYTEEIMEGWEIQLKNASGTLMAATTTNSKGYYWFRGLCAGTYYVEEVLPLGWEQVSPVDPNNHEVTLPDEEQSYDFWNIPLICGYKYYCDSYNGIGGWGVTLKDVSGAPIAATTTDETGLYCFEPVDPGEYVVEEELRKGWNYCGSYYYDFTFSGGESIWFDFWNKEKEGPGPRPECGDGIVNQCSEECDDGNNVSGDGCSADCKTESTGSSGSYFTYSDQGSSGTTPPSQTPPAVLGETGAPSLTVSKTIAQEFANPGDTDILYTITITNNGNLTAFTVTLVDTLPTGLHYADISGHTRTWEMGDIGPGETKESNYKVNVDETAEAMIYTNIAQVSASNHDPVSAQASLEVKGIVVLAETGLSVGEFLALLAVLFGLTGVSIFLRKRLA